MKLEQALLSNSPVLLSKVTTAYALVQSAIFTSPPPPLLFSLSKYKLTRSSDRSSTGYTMILEQGGTCWMLIILPLNGFKATCLRTVLNSVEWNVISLFIYRFVYNFIVNIHWVVTFVHTSKVLEHLNIKAFLKNYVRIIKIVLIVLNLDLEKVFFWLYSLEKEYSQMHSRVGHILYLVTI